MLRIQDPWWLALIVVVCGVYLRRLIDRRNRLTTVAPSGDVLGDLKKTLVERTAFLPELLSFTAVVLLVLALARPQWGQYRNEVESEGVNIMLALDVSESMAALDFRLKGEAVDRLTAVKSVVREFIGRRSGDRVGLVVFGSEAYTQVPLTRDVRALEGMLDAVEIGSAGKSTAIGDAIGIALKRMEDVPSPSNIIILLTDGRSNTGEIDPRTAAEIAAARGVKVYTIGVGGREPAPFIIDDPIFGKRKVYQRVEIDEALLKEIAETTGGRSFRAENLDALDRIYAEIDGMETSTVRMHRYDDFHDRYLWLLIPGVVLLWTASLMQSTRYLEAG